MLTYIYFDLQKACDNKRYGWQQHSQRHSLQRPVKRKHGLVAAGCQMFKHKYIQLVIYLLLQYIFTVLLVSSICPSEPMWQCFTCWLPVIVSVEVFYTYRYLSLIGECFISYNHAHSIGYRTLYCSEKKHHETRTMSSEYICLDDCMFGFSVIN